MKPIIATLIACLAILTFTPRLSAADAKALVLYTEPPNDYIMALEVVTLNPGSVVFSVATLPNGKRQEIPRAGIVAIIDYPPPPPGTVTEQEATAAFQKINAGAQKYPQYRTKLTTASTRWNNALAFSRQNAKATAAQPPPKSAGLELEIGGVKYRDVVLNSFTGQEVGISHADGLAKIPATTLTPPQITALNATSTTVRINPAQIAELQKSNTAPTIGGTPTTPSVSPDEAAEIARLKAAAATAEATVNKLKAEEEAIRAQMQSPAHRSKETGPSPKLEQRSAEVSRERLIAERKFAKAAEDLRVAEQAIDARSQAAKVEAYRTTATLPPTSTDWEAVVRKWTDQVAAQTKVSAAAQRAFEGRLKNPGMADQLRTAMTAELEKLEVAKKTLSEAKRRSAEAARAIQAEKQRVADIEKSKMQAASTTESEKRFRSLPVNIDRFVTPTVTKRIPGPDYQATIAFLSARIGEGFEIGYGEATKKMIVRLGWRTLVFDPKDLNTEVKYGTERTTFRNGFGVSTGQIDQHYVTLECRNFQSLIQCFDQTDDPTREGASSQDSMVFPVRDKIEAEKTAAAFAQLIKLFGGTKDPF